MTNNGCRKWACVGIVALSWLVAAGCGGEAAPESLESIAAKPAGPTSTFAGEAVGKPSVEEAAQFGEAIEVAVVAGDIEQVNALIDWDTLAKAASSGFGESEEIEQARTGFAEGIKSASTQSGSLFAVIAEQVQQGAGYSMLHVHEVDGEQRVMFRLLPLGGGVNYHDFVVVRRPSGKVVAVDVYLMSSGEMFSQTMRRTFLPVVQETTKGVVARLTGEENDFIQNLEKFESMAIDARTGNHERALATYNSLPDSLKQEKTFMLLRLIAATSAGETEYLAALADFQSRFPDDPCLELMSIDKFIYKKEYDKALAAIERLNQSVGGDPYLKLLSAGIYVEKGDMKNARDLAEQATVEEPTLIDAYWTLISISLHEKKFGDTVAHLNTVVERFQLELGDLTKIPEYAEFVQSPEYAEWMKAQPAQPE